MASSRGEAKKSVDEKENGKSQIITDLFILKLGLVAVRDQIMGENAEVFDRFTETRNVAAKDNAIEVIRTFLASTPSNAQLGKVRKDFLKREGKMAKWRRRYINKYGRNLGSKGHDFYEVMQKRFDNMVSRGEVTQMTSLSAEVEGDIVRSKTVVGGEQCISTYENFYISEHEIMNYDNAILQHYLDNLDILRNHLLENRAALSLLLYCHPDVTLRSPKADISQYIDAFLDYEVTKVQQLIEFKRLSEKSTREYFSLVDQYAYLLHESDFESLDYLIYLFVTKRSDTMKEALHLLDEEKRANRIAESIYGATDYLINNFRTIMVEFGNRIEAALSMMSANISSALQVSIAAGFGNVSAKLGIGSQDLAKAVKKVKVRPTVAAKITEKETISSDSLDSVAQDS